MKGGYRSVDTPTDRNAIPASHRKHGMKVYIKSDNKVYRLASNLTTWNLVSSGTPNPSINSPYTITTHHGRGGKWQRMVCHRYADGRMEYFMRSYELSTTSSSGGWYYKLPGWADLPYGFSRNPASIFGGKSNNGIVFGQVWDIENSRKNINPQMFSPTNYGRGYMYAHLFGRWK